MIRINKKYLLICFLLPVVILFSGHYLSTVIGTSRNIALVAIAAFIVLFEISQKRNGSTYVEINNYCSLFVLMSILTLCANLEFDKIFSYLISLSYIVIARFIVIRLDLFAFIKLYRKTMLLICGIAIAVYVLNAVLGMDFILGTVKSINGINYANNLLFTYNLAPYASFRNYGLFWEPGLFSSFIIIGIVLEAYQETVSPIALSVYVVALLTTFSAAGYLLLFPCIILLILRSPKRNSAYYIKLFVVICSLVGVLIFGNSILETIGVYIPFLAEKILSTENELLLKTTRLESFLVNWKVFIENPIFGSGVVQVNNLFSEYGEGLAQTSTSLYMMATYGFLGVGYTISWFKGIFGQRKISFLEKVCIAIIFIAILNKEPHSTNLMLWILLFYFLKDKQTLCVQ